MLNLKALALLLPLAGCQTGLDWLVIETEVDEVCVVDMPIDFPGVPDGVLLETFGQDDLGIELTNKLSADMYLRGIGLSARDGVESLEFIEQVHVEVSTRDAAPVTLLDYTAQEAPGTEWFVPSDSNIDIAPFLEQEGLALVVEFSGTMPATDWSATMDVCVNARLAYREGL